MNPDFYKTEEQGADSKEFDYIFSRIQIAAGVFRELEARTKRMLAAWPAYWKDGRSVPDEIRRETHTCLFQLIGQLKPETGSREEPPVANQMTIKAMREIRNSQLKARAQEFVDRGMQPPINQLAREFGLSSSGVNLILQRLPVRANGRMAPKNGNENSPSGTVREGLDEAARSEPRDAADPAAGAREAATVSTN